MSILIRGMEMPEKCNECWFADNEDDMCLAAKGEYLDWTCRYGTTGRPSWCPLIDAESKGRLLLNEQPDIN